MASVFSCIYRFTGGSFWGIDHLARQFLLGSSFGNAEGRSAITDVFATKGMNGIESKAMNRCEGYEELFMYSMAMQHAMPRPRGGDRSQRCWQVHHDQGRLHLPSVNI